MVMDYSERKPVNKNRPRKQPVGIFFILIMGAVSISFVLGVATGWFVHKKQVQVAADQPDPAVQPTVQPQKAAPTPLPDPPLTFYETLPKGGKAIIGTGLNPATPHEPAPVPAAQPVSAPVAAVQPAVQTVKPAFPRPEERKEMSRQAAAVPAPVAVVDPVPKITRDQQPAKPDEKTRKYTVQVASTQDRKEAESLRARLESKGIQSYIVESDISGKGTWYRLRAGRSLTHQAAGELASKTGGGALVVPE